MIFSKDIDKSSGLMNLPTGSERVSLAEQSFRES